MSEILPLISAVAAMFFFWGVDMIIKGWNDKSNYTCTLFGAITLFWFLCIMKDIVCILLDLGYVEMQFSIVLDIFSIPLTSLYVFEIVKPGWGTRKRYLKILLPWFIVTLAYGVFFFLLPAATPWIFYLVIAASVAYIIFMLRFVYINQRRYQHLIENNLSFDENINIRWINVMKYAFFWDCITFFLTVFFDTAAMNAIYYISIAFSWWILHYFTCRQKKIPLDEENILDEENLGESPFLEEDSGNNPDAHTERMNEIGERIERIMERNNLYLQPNLTLPDLASAIGSNKTYVYQYLKQMRNTSFSDYINSLRLERKAIPLMKESVENAIGKGIHELTVNEIAFQSGFQSLSTFRRAFQKFMGCNATSYLKDLRKQVKSGKNHQAKP